MHLFRSLIIRIYWIYNRIKFKLSGVNCGMRAHIAGNLQLKTGKKSKITIGNNFTLNSGNFYNPLSRNIKACIVLQPHATLIIGNNVGLSSVCVWVHKSLKIGNNVKIGGDSIILDSNAHSLNFEFRRESNADMNDIISNEIIIEDDVLIGTRCIIQKGVTIGARSIIAAGSVVVKSIPSDCIAGGNPCKVIRRTRNS
jgi:acetyltransferase-like isoleucine patch superfamily enzyme